MQEELKRRCNSCGEEKVLSLFPRNKNGKFGRKSQCHSCVKLYNERNKEQLKIKGKEYRDLNKEKIKERSKKYRENNREAITSRKKEYAIRNYEKLSQKRKVSYAENKDALLVKNKSWRDNNKEYIKTYQLKYYEENKGQIISKNAEYVENRKGRDESFRLRLCIRNLFASKMRDKNIRKKEKFFAYTGVQFDDYLKYFENDALWAKYSEDSNNFHIDHIIPCAIYDFSDPEEIKKCWDPKNLRIIPAKDNLLKKNKLDMELIKMHKIEHLLPNKYKELECQI